MTARPVFVFDLDGVITDATDSTVDLQAVQHIHDLLVAGHLVAINTGRSYGWVADSLLAPSIAMGGGAFFERLYIVGEKGGASVLWNGEAFIPQPSRFALPGATRARCRDIFEQRRDEFDTMFWDETKRTMTTIEKLPEADLERFHDQQHALAAVLEDAFADQDVTIDATTIAIDTQSSAAGKHAGAELIYTWALEHSGTADGISFVSFGDSLSDYEMARYFAQQGKHSTFVFVGPASDLLPHEPGVTCIETTAKYAAGTREYFDSYLTA